MTSPLLIHYDPFTETQLQTDASDGSVGVVLSQREQDGLWNPILIQLLCHLAHERTQVPIKPASFIV
jgi:hypothetical protein